MCVPEVTMSPASAPTQGGATPTYIDVDPRVWRGTVTLEASPSCRKCGVGLTTATAEDSLNGVRTDVQRRDGGRADADRAKEFTQRAERVASGSVRLDERPRRCRLFQLTRPRLRLMQNVDR